MKIFHLSLLVVVLLALQVTGQAQYTYTTLDFPEAILTEANGISGNKIVGNFEDSSGIFHGFLYDGGTFTTLDVLGAQFTYAQGISGDNIVGEYGNFGIDGKTHGFLLTSSNLTTLDFPGMLYTYAQGISGTNIIGYYADGMLNVHGFIYNSSTFTAINMPPGNWTTPLGIYGNTIVGYFSDNNGVNTHGFIYDGQYYLTSDHQGSNNTYLTGVSSNDVVGYFLDGNGNAHGFTLGSVNLLNVPEATSTQARGISENNIVGSYKDSSGHTHGFLAIPLPFTYTTNNNAITITSYTGIGNLVIIPTTINGFPVTSIGNFAFGNCINLTNIIIPNTVTSIGQQAFSGCTSLTSISIPDSVIKIGNDSFYGCTNLGIATIGTNVTGIGNYAFGFCSIQNIIIPSSVTNIGQYAFSGCYGLRSFYFQGNAPSLGSSLYGVNAAAIVYYQSGTSGWSTTYGGLPTEVVLVPFIFTIRNGAVTIAKYTGSGGEVTIPPTIVGLPVTVIGTGAFNSSFSLTSVVIPNGVTNIEYAAFEWSGLTNVSIPDSVINIGTEAFAECNLTSVTIPNGVIRIGDYAFQNCELASVLIPKSVSSLGYAAFDDCSSLTGITVDVANTAYSSIDGVLFDESHTTLITFPEGKFKFGMNSSYTIPNSVTSIADLAFDGSLGLTNVIIPSSVNYIGDYAFVSCLFLTRIYFEGNAPELGSYAFSDVSSVAVVYYLRGMAGWSVTYGGLPTVMLNPPPQISGNSAGVHANGFGFTINGYSNQTVIIEVSTNLVNWQPIQTNVLTGISISFADAQWTNYSYRFYTVQTPAIQTDLNPISINFVGGSFADNPEPLDANQIAGVVAVNNWNNVAQNLANGIVTNLLDSSGISTTASVTWSSDNLWAMSLSEVNANYQLMKGYLDNPVHDIIVSVNGLPHAENDVYVYFNDDNNSTGTIGSYAIGSSKIYGHDTSRFAGTFIQANGMNVTDANAVGNYLVFRNISGTNFTLIAHPEDTIHRSPVNGIQIVPTAP